MDTYKDFLKAEERAFLMDLTETLTFKPSMVYNPIVGANFIDHETRQSKTAILDYKDNKQVAEMINTMMKRLLSSGHLRQHVSAVLNTRRYVTFIRYDPGDFFDWHQDYTRYRGVYYRTKECHLLICLEAPDEGGELQIHDESDRRHPKDPTVTEEKPLKASTYSYSEGEAILFDKTRYHRALPVTRGSKLILSVDVETTESSDSEQFEHLIEMAEKKNVLIRDVDIINAMAHPAKAETCHKWPLLLIIRNEARDTMVVFDSTGLIFSKFSRYVSEAGAQEYTDRLKATCVSGIVDCRRVMYILATTEDEEEDADEYSYYDDEPTIYGWPLNLAPFVPYAKPMTTEELQKIMKLPVIGDKPEKPFAVSQRGNWCNEEYEAGYYREFETFISKGCAP